MNSIGRIGVLLPEIVDLLEFSDLRIQEIAQQCGYNNESHFMRQFKMKTGMTVLQYRKKHTGI